MSQTTGTAERRSFSLLEIVYIGICAALLAVCSQIYIPLPPPLVQFTMQTFAVFCTLELLGGKRGFCAILVFILLGAAGVPVFSGMQGGFSVLLGKTGGYIVGFLLTALIYWAMTHFLGNKLWVRITALVTGLLVCYAFGTIWFIRIYTSQTGAVGVMTALGWCVLPYLLPDAAKMVLAFVLTGQVRKQLKLS